MAKPAPAGYSGTPLPKKLGIKEDSVVVLVAPPTDFASTLGPLPEGAALRRRDQGRRDLTILFARRARDLERLPGLADRMVEGMLWVAWPKRSSGVATDVTESLVRESGLATGLVDTKICAIDATWSALRFNRRRA